MRQIRTCTFCADEAVGTFELVPDELDPSEDEQRRVSLCGECKEQIIALLRPLMDRLKDDQKIRERETQRSSKQPTEAQTMSEEERREITTGDSQSTPTNTQLTKSTTGSIEQPPRREYRKVLRLLQNRELPIERSAAVDLGSNAYELRPNEVHSMIDFGIERGEIQETEGSLYLD